MHRYAYVYISKHSISINNKNMNIREELIQVIQF